MREIKFRVWNLDKKQWEDVLKWAIAPEDGSLVDAYEPGIFTIAPFNYEIMQFTGLKDKDGVDIYENDIIVFDSLPNRKVHIEWRKRDACFNFGGWYENNFPDTDTNATVIGNIYENPELLENVDN